MNAVARVERITPDWWETLRDVRLAALRDAPYAFSTRYEDMAEKGDDHWREMAARWTRYPDGCTFLAFAPGGGDTVGMAGGYRNPGEEGVAYLVAMWVAPGWRGTGAADLLVEAVSDWAAALPVGRLGAWVTGGNDRALRFYGRLGFVREPDASRPHAPDPSLCEILMVRRLLPPSTLPDS